MKLFAVIDTNVIVSSMITRNPVSPTRRILDEIRDGIIVPMLNQDVFEEYTDVLSREKFRFACTDIVQMLKLFDDKGQRYVPNCLRQDFIDLNDVIFYETYKMRNDAYLITGNLKHFPQEARIVSPSDMINILNVAYKPSGDMLNEPGLQYIPSSIHIAWEAVERMRASAVANGVSDMSMEEIDEEIRQYREERRSRL